MSATRQLGFFDAVRRIEPKDPQLTPAEKKRLGPKCYAIRDRLRVGPASGSELARITHRFSARIWDLRRAGFGITTDHNRESGATVYTLTHEPDGF